MKSKALHHLSSVKLRLSLLCTLTALLTCPLHGTISLVVNSTEKTLTMLGSDTGTVSVTQKFQWDLGAQSGSTGNIQGIPATLSLGSFTNVNIPSISIWDDGSFRLVATTTNGNGSTFTMTGSETPISYASLGSTYQTFLETAASNGTSIPINSNPLFTGTGLSPATFSLAAVPEPSTYAAIIGLFSLALVVRRRQVKQSR